MEVKSLQSVRHELTGFKGIVLSRLVPILTVEIEQGRAFVEIGVQNEFGSVQFFDEEELTAVKEGE